MDIFSALQTSVSGLRAQSYAIGNISGNIANSQTTGFRRIDTQFVDLMAEQTPKREVSGTVLAQAQLTNTIAGPVSSTSVPTNMAIDGSGFFVVKQRTSDANGQATFGAENLYTRRGDFAPDKNGYLVNGAGGYLQGQNVDPATGTISATGPIRIDNATMPARQTTTITYGANLPATPSTTNSATTGSSLYAPTDRSTLVTATDGTVTNGLTIPAANAAQFVDSSIAGPALSVYTQDGTAVSLSTRWAKIQDANATTGAPAVWNLFYASDTGVANTATPWVNAGTGVTFNAAGQLIQPASGSIPIQNLTVDGAAVGNVNIAVSRSSLSQQASSLGTATTDTLTQDGYAAGTLTDIAITEEGAITGTFSNGAVSTLANVGIVRFTNPDGLKPDSGGNFRQTADSGEPLAGLNGSSLIGSSIEQSNTDIADEFSKMIVTQQAYSANTRVMSTAQTMMSDLLNVIR